MDDNNRTRRSFLTAAGTAAVGAALAGCAGEPPADTDNGGQDQTTGGQTTTDDGADEEPSLLVYGRGADSSTLDPQATTSGEVAKVTNQIYDTLIGFEPGTTTLAGALATDFSLEGTTATLTLREGVKFHNGEEFTAQDFVATYRRFLDEDYEYYLGDTASVYGPYLLGNVENISADGDYSLTFELGSKYAPFLANLAVFALAVLPKSEIEGGDLKSQPVGTGAFAFENHDTSNKRITLSANNEYWGDGPNVDEVIFSTISSNSTRAQSLANGEVDIIDGLGAQQVKQIENANGASVASVDGMNVGYMAFNLARFEPFRDKRVRQAINYAIDTKSIVESIYQGIASQASHPLPPGVLGYNKSLDPYPHDPEKARSLLQEAGYSDLEFELATFQNPRAYNPSPVNTAETVRSNLSDVGVTVNLEEKTWSSYLEYTGQGKHDAAFLGWMSDNGDPDNFYYALLHPQVEPPEGQDWVSFDTEGFNTSNRAAWANREFMDLVEQGQNTYDTAERRSLYEQAGEVFYEEVPWVTLAHTQEIRGVRDDVSGFTISLIGGPYLHLVEL